MRLECPPVSLLKGVTGGKCYGIINTLFQAKKGPLT